MSVTAIDNTYIKRYAALAVPRYTSYPTAADFSPVTPEQHASWLADVRAGDAVSLYIHVPYCRQICYYCGCFTKSAIRNDIIRTSEETIIDEISLVGGLMRARPSVTRLHWGGGTPTILGADGLRHIVETLERYFHFSPSMEHAIELDPRYVTPDMAKELAALGINRASLGVQDVDATVQRAIGRIQPFETIARAVTSLRDAGIENLNFDLIYGLPYQTVTSLRATCEAVASLSPDRVACYGYAHLPQRRANQRLIDERALPGSVERFEQARAVAASFAAQGYATIGIDHFAKPGDALAIAAGEGRLHRNFQGYTDDNCETLIGFGPSSISRFREGFAQTKADIGQYGRAIAEGRLATARGHVFTEEDHIRSGIIERLMCDFAVDLASAAPSLDLSGEKMALQRLAVEGILRLEGNRVTMTERGRPFVRLAAAVFDAFREDHAHSFSAAV
ncbi:coproporphyrinogen-III oxidase [Brucella endophytica]|uniref:Coproporphyrinogen-III oxidase n=1 Tax=Brucella endophytica TaxID=1963359 RepID=A0A916SCW5_9HYPH|nr:coproporphyrinogen-III oxidase [Brucella endophytica]